MPAFSLLLACRERFQLVSMTPLRMAWRRSLLSSLRELQTHHKLVPAGARRTFPPSCQLQLRHGCYPTNTYRRTDLVLAARPWCCRACRWHATEGHLTLPDLHSPASCASATAGPVCHDGIPPALVRSGRLVRPLPLWPCRWPYRKVKSLTRAIANSQPASSAPRSSSTLSGAQPDIMAHALGCGSWVRAWARPS